MRILHILDHSIPLHSGYTFRTRAILREQARLGWQTFHVTSPKQGICESDIETVDGLTFYRTPVPSGRLSELPVLGQWSIVSALKKRLLEVIEEVKPDILHAHSPSLNGIAAVQVGRQLGLPVVYEVRAFWEDAAVDHGTSREGGLRYHLTRYSETWVLKRATAVTVICNGLKNEMLKRGISEDKITRIPNAVDLENFSPIDKADTQLLKQLGLEQKKILGFIGSFYAYEGLDLVLDAMPGLLEKDSNFHLLLVGGGPEEERLKNQVNRLGIEQAVTFTGRVPHEEVGRYYSLVDALVYARHSMRLTETVTPLKPLEAMAQHKLVIASDVGGHHELIEDRQTGYLFKHGNVESLIETVQELFAKEDTWPVIKRMGRHYVETQRNWPVSVANYKSVYAEAVGHELITEPHASKT